ncbi:hypothetical protein HQ520_08765, partial [bacterium]|nr:hypothetical protein [bacterium]
MSNANPSTSPPPFSQRQWALIVLLFLLALAHRWNGLGQAPEPYQMADESHYLWAGLSLLHGEKATSWSLLPGYAKTEAYIGRAEIDSHSFHIVRPALDHPPLFSLIAGIAA